MVEQNKSKASLIVTKFDLQQFNQKLANIGQRLNALEGIGQQTVRLGTRIRGVTQGAVKNTDLTRKGELLVDGEPGNLVMLDADGELIDSGYSPADLLGTDEGVRSICRAYRSTAIQTVAPSYWTGVGLDAIEYDLLGEFILDTNAWTLRAGQPGAEILIISVCVFNGKLYGASGASGKLFEWDNVSAWVEKAPQLGAEIYIKYLCVFNNKLYGGTAAHGCLYEWNGTNAWVQVAPQLGAETDIQALLVFNSKLYGSTHPHGCLYEWNGTNAWVQVAPQLGAGTNIACLCEFNGKLYGGTSPNGNLYEWNGVNLWVSKAPLLGTGTTVYVLVVYNNNLYGGTESNGNLYVWNNVNAWIQKAPQFGAETAIRSLAVFENNLYGGTFPGGKLLKWDDTSNWLEKAPTLVETIILSLCVFNGKLYGGTCAHACLYEWDGADSKFIASEAGKYRVNATIKLNDTNILAGRQVWLGLYKNDSIVVTAIVHTSHAGVITIPISSEIDMSEGSYLELYLYHTMTSEIQLAYGNAVSHMEVSKIS